MSDRAVPEKSGARSAVALPSRQATATSNQIRQRQAVAALRERMQVQITSQVYRDSRLQSTRVLVGGDFYDVDETVLAKLRSGSTPEQLELDAVDCGDDC